MSHAQDAIIDLAPDGDETAEHRAAAAVMDFSAIRDRVPYDPDAPAGQQVPTGDAFPSDVRELALQLLSYLGLYPGSEDLRTTFKSAELAQREPCQHHHDQEGST